MNRRETLRLFAILLLLGVYLFSLFGATVVQAGGRPGGGPPGMEEEEEEEEEEEWDGYRHSDYRGIGYGTKWNYSLTFAWGTQPLWLYGDGHEALFKQRVESGDSYDVIQLTLWTQEAYDEVAICMEPGALETIQSNGVQQILVKHTTKTTGETRKVLYQVQDLYDMLENAGVQPDEVLHIWVGEETGPRLVLKGWVRVQLEPGDDKAVDSLRSSE